MLENGFCATKANHVCVSEGMLRGVLYYQGKSCLHRGQDVRRWLYGTKTTMCASWMVCYKMALLHQSNFFLHRRPNVGTFPCGIKKNHVVVVDQMLDIDMVAKASSVNPRPSFLYLEARMYGRNFLWINEMATHSFMSPKLIRESGLADTYSGEPINVWFGKGMPHEINKVALHVTL